MKSFATTLNLYRTCSRFLWKISRCRVLVK